MASRRFRRGTCRGRLNISTPPLKQKYISVAGLPDTESKRQLDLSSWPMHSKQRATSSSQPKTFKERCKSVACYHRNIGRTNNSRSEKFTQAIELDPTNHVLYSNRSGAYTSIKQWENALEDANKTVEIKPDWAKGWGRKGAALHGAGDLVNATDAYEEAIKLDPANAQAKSGLDSVKRAIEAEAKADGFDPSQGLGGMFNDPKLVEKLAVTRRRPPCSPIQHSCRSYKT